MSQKLKRQLLSFAREMAVYAILVSGYLFLVVHYLSGWFAELFRSDRRTYAAAALAAVVIQGLLLEKLTHVLLHLLKLDKRGPE
jgi:uncharacterized membrane protein YcjF (UPF0283 family)